MLLKWQPAHPSRLWYVCYSHITTTWMDQRITSSRTRVKVTSQPLEETSASFLLTPGSRQQPLNTPANHFLSHQGQSHISTSWLDLRITSSHIRLSSATCTRLKLQKKVATFWLHNKLKHPMEQYIFSIESASLLFLAHTPAALQTSKLTKAGCDLIRATMSQPL